MSGWRECCRAHAAARAAERGCPAPLDRLERLCRRMLPAYLERGRGRYVLTIRGHGWRWQVVWDLDLDCLVTVWPAEGGGRRE